MRYYCLQHVAFETPGLLAGLIRQKGHSLRITDISLGEALPSTADFDGLIVMGGPMSIHDEDVHPWLRAEKLLIAAAIREGKKVLGIQFHPEVTPEIIRAMIGHEGWELVEAPYIQPAERILDEVEGPEMREGERAALAMLTDWL